MRRHFSPQSNSKLLSGNEADHSAAIESIVTEVKYELDNLAYEEGKLLALRAHLTNVQYMQAQNSHKDRILDACSHTNRVLELENQVLKIEQTKHNEVSFRIRELEINLSKTLEDKKKIECFYIDTNNLLKKALHEIDNLSRRNADLDAVVEKQKKELEVERSTAANFSNRLLELGSRVIGQDTLTAEIEQWKRMHSNLESILSAFKVQHTTLQQACSREINELKESLVASELQRQSHFVSVNDLISCLRHLSHDANIVSATLKLSSADLNVNDGVEFVGFDLFGQRAEVLHGGAHQNEAGRHVMIVADFIRRLLRKVFHLQQEQNSSMTRRSIECIRRISIGTDDSQDQNDSHDINLHLLLHTLVQNLVEYTQRLESAFELEKQEKNDARTRFDELARSHKIQLQQMRDNYSVQVSEAQRASEEALSAIYIAQKEAQRDYSPQHLRTLNPELIEEDVETSKQDDHLVRPEHVSFYLEHAACELHALQEKLDALSMAYRYVCKRNEELVEAESRIQFITEYCLEMGEQALPDWKTGVGHFGRGKKFRPFRVVAIAVLAANRMRRLFKQRRKMEMRIHPYHKGNWKSQGNIWFALLPSVEDCRDFRSADIAQHAVQAVFNADRSSNLSKKLPSRSLLNTIKLGGFGNDYSHSPVRSSYRNLFSEPTQRIFNSVICLDFIQKHIQSLRERLDWHDQNDGRLKAAADRANEQLRKALSDLHAAQDDVRCLHVDIAALQRLNKRHSSNSNATSPVDPNPNPNLSDSFTPRVPELSSDLYRPRRGGGAGDSPSQSGFAEDSNRSAYRLWGVRTPRGDAMEHEGKVESGQASSRSRSNISLTEIYNDIGRLQGRLESRMKSSMEDR